MSKILRAVCEQMPKNLDFDRIWRQEAIDFEDLRGDKGVLYSPSGGPARPCRASQPPPRPHPLAPMNRRAAAPSRPPARIPPTPAKKPSAPHKASCRIPGTKNI